MRRIPFVPIRIKLLAFYVAICFIPLSISGMLIYSSFSDSSEKNATFYSQQIMDSLVTHLEDYFTEIRRLTIYPLYEDTVIELMEKYDRPYQTPSFALPTEQSRTSLYLSSLSFDRPEITGIFLFTNQGVLFSNLGSDSVNAYWNADGSEDWMNKVRMADGGAILLPPNVGEYYRSRSDTVISVARLIKEPFSQKELGIIRIDLSPSVFYRILSTASLTEHSLLYVSDNEGNLFYPIQTDFDKSLLTLQGNVTENGVDYIATQRKSSLLDLTLVGMLSLKDLQKDAGVVIQFMSLTLVGTLLLSIVLSIIISRRLTNPIRHLHSKMKRVQNGNFQERAEIVTNDEIGYLSTSFNHMVQNIDDLVKKVYVTQMRERDAEISALQSQINPHFLYNTLELINMTALENKQFEISDITSSLGRLLRYTVDRQNKLVNLAEEMNFIEAYLNIHVIRRDDDLQVEMWTDEEIRLAKVPKLIIQPIVENALEHGLIDGKGSLVVRAVAIESNIEIRVMDGGRGLTLEERESILTSMNQPESLAEDEAERFGRIRKGYALRNVHQRIQLLYGENYGIDICSNEPKGTVFVLKLPFVKFVSKET